MGKTTKQQRADLAADACNIRAVTKPNDTPISIEGNYYRILTVHNSRSTGYQRTVYQSIRIDEIVVAHRGTESPKANRFDTYTDWDMIAKGISYQTAESEKLVRQAMMLADVFHQDYPYLPRPNIARVGHPLSGAHVRIQVYRFGHEGITFNGYGAVGMHGVREGGGDATNYVKATGVVSTANAHHGRVVVLATEGNLKPLRKYGYGNQRNTMAIQTVAAAAVSVGSAHSSLNFVGRGSILSGYNYDRARCLTDEDRFMIQDYHGDVETPKNAIAATRFATSNPIEKIEILRNRLRKYDREQKQIKEIINGVPPPESLLDNRMLHMMQNDGIRPDAGKEAYADTDRPDISRPLAKNASANEFHEYGFAASLSNDDDKIHATLDSPLGSDVGRGLRQNAGKICAAQEREQKMARLAEEQARRVDALVMRTSRD